MAPESSDLTAFLQASGTPPQEVPDPELTPSFQVWKAMPGEFDLRSISTIEIPAKAGPGMVQMAEDFCKDLEALTHCRLRLAGGEGHIGGIRFILEPQRNLGGEAYEIEIDQEIVARASTSTGLYYASQSLLQMAVRTRGRMPRGRALDYPRFAERAIMLDLGRRYWEMQYLEELMRVMAWLKLNVLHLHFNDWNGFRLRSEKHPGLASEQAYGRGDIRQLQQLANRYHIRLVPELDFPAHATGITEYAPHLAFKSPSMRRAQWQKHSKAKDPAWTLDITRHEVRDWIRGVIEEFIPLFEGPEFHIGGDEWQWDAEKMECPELMEEARRRGWPYPGDVFVNWINEVNALVKSHGKLTQIWTWWNYCQPPDRMNRVSLCPDQDIVMNAWNPGLDDSLMRQGYEVIYCPEDQLYITPGLGTKSGEYGYCDAAALYAGLLSRIKLVDHKNMRGLKMCVWCDQAEEEADGWFERFMARPRAVLAELSWSGRQGSDVAAFFERICRIGNPPGVKTAGSTQYR